MKFFLCGLCFMHCFIAIFPNYAFALELTSQQALVEEYRHVVNNQNMEGMFGLLHKSSVTCIKSDTETEDYYKNIIKTRYFVKKISENIKISYTMITPQDSLIADSFFPGKFNYPVRPNYRLNLDWNDPKNPYSGYTIVREIYCDPSEGCTFIEPCPNAGTLSWLNEQQTIKIKKEKDFEEKANQALESLPDDLKTKVMGEISKGHTLAAAKILTDFGQYDLEISHAMIKILIRKNKDI